MAGPAAGVQDRFERHQAVMASCRHPSGGFTEFADKELDGTLVGRFERQVHLHGPRAAIRCTTGEQTYEELNAAANRVAWAILSHGGAHDGPVALLLDTDVAMLSAILGTLKAARTYVPLHPSNPEARTRYMLEDSGSKVIVTNRPHLPLARKLALDGVPIIDLDELDPELSIENPGLDLSPDAPVWILYTSGSTGQPKGVVQTHRSVLYFTMTYTNCTHICVHDRVSLVFQAGVNAGAHNMFAALLNGATLCVFDPKRENLTELADWLSREEITLFSLVPTLFRFLADSLIGPDRFPFLRMMMLFGESVYARDVDLYKKHMPDTCVLVNRLGSSETGVVAWYFIDKETDIGGMNAPVGYSVPGTETLLMDESGGEVTDGEVGEIAARTRYLSPGYWRKPELTRQAFLPDPEGGHRRIYRTGDLGQRVDGCLLHVSRKDFQVKVRGYRVEVGEVEMALLESEAVAQAAVVGREFRAGEQRLVAYVATDGVRIPDPSGLRAFLAERLPDYMLPSAFVFMETLPDLPNGKINRKGLPAPTWRREELLGDAPIPPCTPVEKMLVSIWGQVLGMDNVGVDDNFLDLGGDSLLAAQIVSRVISAYRIEIPVRSLLDAPTVADMAVAISAGQAGETAHADVECMLAELEDLADGPAAEILGESAAVRQEPS